MADLTQDIAGPIPLDLLRAWAGGAQDLSSAVALLSGFRIEGTVVVSDSTGLTRMCSASHDIADVLAMISMPKGVVHAVGVEIGGRPIGTWVADNTEMYYPAGVPVETILAAIAETQFRLTAAASVGLGLCIHRGAFYEIGGGLYGRDADLVESLAEHDARAGETLVTDSIVTGFRGDDFRFERRADVDAGQSQVFTLVANRRMPELKADRTDYPHPFPPEFFGLLNALRDRAQAGRIKQEIHDRYLQDRAVVFLAIARDDVTGPPDLLDGLVLNALLDTIITSTAGALDHIAASSGGLGILTFETVSEAVDFAITIRAQCMRNALPVKIGIDRGPLLLFSQPRGGITGDPVNIASKISEDAGATGRINISSRAAAQLENVTGGLPYQIKVSGLDLDGIFL